MSKVYSFPTIPNKDEKTTSWNFTEEYVYFLPSDYSVYLISKKKIRIIFA